MTHDEIIEVMAMALFTSAGAPVKYWETQHETIRKKYAAEATHVLSALESRGMVVVPVEPTEQAVLNGYYVYGQSLYGSPQQGHGEVAADIYRAMLAAKE